jgi:trehalose-6-phosphate synthase
MANPASDNKELRLLVVSNRLPVTVSKDPATNDYAFKMSSGGLVSALSGLKKMMKFTWIGWPGTL